MKKLLPALTVLLACLPAWADSSITHIELIPLHPGVNQIPDLLRGRDGVIVEGWRNTCNAPGYDVYMTLLGDKTGGISDKAKFRDVINDSPHTFEDAVKSVRFARGKLDGHSVTLMITATPNL